MRGAGKALVIAGGVSALPAAAMAFSVGDRWDWQLSEPIDLARDVDVLDLHPGLVEAPDIAGLKALGIETICYVSVGTLEKTSPDRAAFPASVVGKTYEDWPDERFLDIRRLDILLPLMRERFRTCKQLGFDAVEPDNMDVHDNDSGFALTANDAVRYISALAEVAHGMGLKIGQKNVPELTDRLVAILDFVITESCHQDEWCADVSAYTASGKPVYDAEYTDEPLDFDAACAEAKRLSLSMIVKDRDLHAPVRACP